MYQFQFAPVAKLPPFNPSDVLLPWHIGVVPVADVAAIEELIIIVMLAQDVELHIPTALT